MFAHPAFIGCANFDESDDPRHGLHQDARPCPRHVACALL